MVATDRGSGRYYAGEADLVMLPRQWRAGAPAVIYCHGATQTVDQMIDVSTYNGIRRALTAVANAGFPVVGIHGAGDAWGNATHLSRITAGITYARNTIGASSDPVILIGGSMGGGAVQAYAGNFAASVACVVGFVPVCDLLDLHDNRGFGASIDAAYGGAYSDASDGPDHSPVKLAAAGRLNTVPFAAWYGASDATCIPSITQACVANQAHGVATSVAGTHNTALDNIPADDVVSFILRNTP